MTMLAHPPPDAPAPPPSEAALNSRRKMGWLWFVGVGSLIILVLAGLSAPMFSRRSYRKPNRTEAVNNARQVGIALIEFENEYGKFPDPSTIAAVRAKTDTTLNLGTVSSNDYFRQLIGSEIAQSEVMFFAKIANSRKPDGIITGTSALAKGECGFTYFLGATVTENPSRPLLASPMIPGTDRFDPKPFEGKSLILKMDSSVSSYTIDKDGHVMIDGRNMMDPNHPIWNGHAPSIAWPE